MTKKQATLCMLYAFAKVKSKRMPKAQAVKEAKEMMEKSIEDLFIEDLDDMYRGMSFLIKEVPYFQQKATETVLRLQRPA